MDKNKEIEELAAEFERRWRQTKLPQMDAYDLLDLMDYYTRAGLDFEAELCRQCAERYEPDNPEVVLTRAHWAADDGDWASVHRECKRAMLTQYDKAFFDVEYYVRLARPADADKCVKQVLPTITDMPEHDFLLDCATLFRDFGYADRALSWLELIPAGYTDYAAVRSLRAECYAMAGRFDQARRELNEQLDANPFDQDLWAQLGHLCMLMHDDAGVLEACEYSQAIGPSAEASRLQGLVKAQQGEGVEGMLSQAVVEQDYQTCAACGDVLRQTGRFKEAYACYAYAGLYCPRGHRDRERIVAAIAQCLVHMGRYEEAYEQLVSAIALGAGTWNECVQMAALLFQKDQAEHALRVLQLFAQTNRFSAAQAECTASLLAHHDCYEPARALWQQLLAERDRMAAPYKGYADEAAKRLGL